MSREKILLFILAAIQFTHIVDFMIMMPLGPQLMRLFSINPQQFALLVSAYTISASIFGFIGAFFIDRFDRKKVLLFLYIGFAVGTLACAFAPTYLILLVTRSLAGAFGGVLGALILSIVGDAIPNERRATAMGIVMASFSLASVIGVPFGLFLANQFSWHAPFLFLAGAAALVIVLIYIYIPSMTGHLEAQPVKRDPLKIITNITTDPNQLKALLFMVLLMFGQFTIVPFLSPYMVANVGFTENQLTLIYLVGGALTFFTTPLIGRLADKHGRKLIFTIFAVLNLIPLFIITNLPRTEVAIALLITAIFFIFSGGRMTPAMTMITSAVKPQNRGSFMSINSSVQHMAAGIASLLAGVVVGKNAAGELTNYHYVGYIAVASSILAIFVGRMLVVNPAPAISPVKEQAAA